MNGNTDILYNKFAVSQVQIFATLLKRGRLYRQRVCQCVLGAFLGNGNLAIGQSVGRIGDGAVATALLKHDPIPVVRQDAVFRATSVVFAVRRTAHYAVVADPVYVSRLGGVDVLDLLVDGTTAVVNIGNYDIAQPCRNGNLPCPLHCIVGVTVTDKQHFEATFRTAYVTIFAYGFSWVHLGGAFNAAQVDLTA